MPTLKDIEREWADLNPDERLQNEKALGYIRSVAATVGVDIKRWDILEVFGSGDGPNLLTEFTKLNKRFFDKYAATPRREGLNAPSPEVVKAIHFCLAASYNQELRRVKQNLEAYRQQASESHDRFNLEMRRAAQAQAQYNALSEQVGSTERGEAAARALVDALNGGFWTDLRVKRDEPSLWLRTAQDIILTEKNRAANLDIEVNLGQFALKIGGARGACLVNVYPYKGNRNCHAYWHPHFNQEGAPCWGDAHEVAKEHLLSWNIKPLLELVAALLTAYSDHNPYQPLATFKQAGRYERIPAAWQYPAKEVV